MVVAKDSVQIRGLVERTTEKSALISGRWYSLTRAQQEAGFELPSYGADVLAMVHTWNTPDGKEMHFLDQWQEIGPTYEDLEMVPPPADRHETPLDVDAALGPPPLRDDKPVVTRLACLNAAVATFAALAMVPARNVVSNDDEGGAFILGLAERYVTWATWGGNATAGS